MRRLVILALLLGGMQLIRPLGTVGHGSEALLAFGLLILAAYTVGEIATQFGLPKLVGYLLAGMVFGPSVLGVVAETGIARLSEVSRLAVGLIAFLAGAELRWGEMRARGLIILKIMTAELACTFAAVTLLLFSLRGLVPPLAALSAVQALAFSTVFAAVAMVHSPAVTMALLTETRARGPVARTTLGIVLISDIVVVLVFSAALSVARALIPPIATTSALSLAGVIWEIGGGLVIGAVLGGATALYLRFVHRELLLFAIVIAFFGIEFARLLHVEMMLTLLTAGFITQNLWSGGEALRQAMERSAAPVIVVFFALAGATIDVAQVVRLSVFVLPIALVRGGAIWIGASLGTRWARAEPAERRWVWLGLVSQAGVAIALVSILSEAYPERGGELRTFLLSLIAVNEMVGPILFRRGLVASGEASPREPSPRPMAATTGPRGADGS